MKKRLVLFFTFLSLSLCLLTVFASADSIYDDFTKTGKGGEDPIFKYLGFSTCEGGDSIGVGYALDIDALEAYEERTGSTLKYGLVITLKEILGGFLPLDNEGNAIIDNDKVIIASFENDFSRISASFKEIPTDNFDTHLIMSLYVVDPDLGVAYIGEESAYEGPESISLSDALSEKGATPAVPPVTEVKIGNITYAIDAVTEKAWDRVRQQNASNADYNVGSYKKDKEINGSGIFNPGIMGKAQLIAAGGSLINMPMASNLMSHYLKNTGENYNFDVDKFMKEDSGALACRNAAINNALRAAEQIARKGKTLTVGQLTEGHPMQWQLATQNYQYALGSYFDDVDIINLTVTEVDGVKTYSADIKYIVIDYYNWDTNDYNKFKKIVSPHDLHELHRGGVAREFLTYGEMTYKNITWTEGQTVDQIVGLN
jgi:hypothetical protein